MKVITLDGIKITDITVPELHGRISTAIENREHTMILNVNIHAMNIAARDKRFRDILNSSSLTFCDGNGVRLAATMFGIRMGPRITYADWMWKLSGFCAQKGYSLFLLGAMPGVAEQAGRSLRERFPKLCIAGTHHGHFNHSSGSAQNKEILHAIQAARPDILIVCFGMPLQEKWLQDNWGLLTIPVALTGGAALDYISGRLSRGPRLLYSHGHEWLARLLVDPVRLWKRYLVGNTAFFLRVMLNRLRSGNPKDPV
jgi:N-acetylglucosaminyldiphosphoundecaprenol N-acetyl-beta-D-mannosaminyltransferase